MHKAVRLHKHGGPDVLRVETVQLEDLKPGQIRVRHKAAGLNYIDIYQRTGEFSLTFPSGLGIEAAGVVEAVSEDVVGLSVGDRVAYGTGPLGGYSERANVRASRVAKLPESIGTDVAAGMMLKGLTARMLVRDVADVQAGQTVLVLPAAGGVGCLLTQWLSHLGATVIGGVGSDEKKDTALQNGCEHVINYRQEDLAKRVVAITDGRGVDAVLDGVGAATFSAVLDCTAKMGLIAMFGTASGSVTDFDTSLLNSKGSLFLTRPSISHYAADDTHLATMAADLFELVTTGVLNVDVRHRYALADVAQAHRDLEARKTTGSVILETGA